MLRTSEPSQTVHKNRLGKADEARRSSSDGMRVAVHGARKSAAQSLSGLDNAQRYRQFIANEAAEAKAERAMDGYH